MAEKQSQPVFSGEGAASHPAAALFITYLQQMLADRTDWRPSRDDYKTALRILRDHGWPVCINAMLGYATWWRGGNTPAVARIAEDVLAFAAMGEIERRKVAPAISALEEARTKAATRSRSARSIGQIMLSAAETMNDKALKVPSAYPVIAGIDDPVTFLPDPKPPFVGEGRLRVGKNIAEERESMMITGMEDIAEAFRKVLGLRTLSTRRASDHLKASGIEKHDELAPLVYIDRADFERWASGKPDAASGKRPKLTD